MPPATRVSLEDVARIVNDPDPVLRNLRITQCYHALSAELSRAIDPASANWSTFATWASKTAGLSIRDEEVPRLLLALLRDGERLRPRVGPVFAWIYRHTAAKVDVFQQARDTIRRISEEVADGNRKVFAELAPLFVRFIDTMATPEAERPARLQEFLATLRPGPSDRGGQDVLRGAFTNYAAAAVERDPCIKAQLILLANCQIGLHEQTRLQDDIKGAMDAPVAEMITDGIGRLLAVRLAFRFLWPLGVTRERVRAAIQEDWQCLATRLSMRLSLPDGRVLPLGGDRIPWPNEIPDALRQLTNADLIALLRQFDDDLAKLRTHGARNWSRLHDRMGFICELFRAEQQSADLFGPPFSPEAEVDITRGVVPRAGM
ncbi:MAG: hypothetical protein AB7Q16_07640 [Vicinamibacterales bacterium]